eukprot:3104784-Amphidinium_carterae.1
MDEDDDPAVEEAHKAKASQPRSSYYNRITLTVGDGSFTCLCRTDSAQTSHRFWKEVLNTSAVIVREVRFLRTSVSLQALTVLGQTPLWPYGRDELRNLDVLGTLRFVNTYAFP